MVRVLGFAFAAATLLGSAADRVAAQDYPSAAIRMLTGFAAGGTADIIARELGAELEKAGANGWSSRTAPARTARWPRSSSPEWCPTVIA